MTRINKMVMHGFKSFANRTELLFGGDFNCVLGPNGSGKSNVLDSLCFVLGKSGAKGLRAEKSANLIYNGGKLKNPAKQGEVSIYFDNKDKTFPTDDSEIKITRIITKSGQSKYKINNKTRTRQQILDLLAIAKINPDAYNIILQGDIAHFTQMPSTERRKLIEDISGISIYEEKKHKALLELEKVETKLQNAGIILKERGSYLKELRKDRDEALKYKDMNDKIKQNKASYLNIQINKAETNKSSLQKSIDSQKEKTDNVDSIIGKLQKNNLEKREELEKLNKTIEEGSETGQVELTREIEDIKIILAKNHTQIEHHKDEINRIKKQRQDLGNELKQADEKVSDLEKKKEELLTEKTKNLNEREELVNKIKKFKNDNNPDAAGDIEQEIVSIDDNLEELQKKIHELREKQQNIIRKKDNVDYQINTFNERIKKVLQIEKDNKDQVNQLKKQREEFIKTTADLNDLLNNDSEISKRLADYKQSLFNNEQELSKLTAKNIAIQESIYGDIAIKKILALKNPKVYGVIADLGDVDSKYSLALETAAGLRIKSIVVEDDTTAAECINYLKKNRFGIANFLPLNKLNIHKRDLKFSKGEGCHGLAIDLVSFDNKFKKAFEYVFSDVLVVDDIETARKIGIGSAKMVTLDGDLTDIKGGMKGGYRDKKKGLGFKAADVTNQIKKFELEISEIQNKISNSEKKRSSNEGKIEELRKTKANLEGEIIVKEKSLHLEDSDVDINKNQINELKNELEKQDKELDEVINKISSVNKEIAQEKIKKSDLRGKIKQLKNPLLLAELNTFEDMKTTLNEEIIRLDTEIKNIDEQRSEMHDPEKQKTHNVLNQIEKESTEFSNKIKTLEEQNSEKEIVLKEKESKANEFYSKFKTMFDKKKRIDEEVSGNEKVIDSKKDEKRDVEIKLNGLSIKIAEINAKLAELNQEFEEYHGVDILTNVSEEDLKKEISKFEKMRENIGSVNMRSLDIYEDVEKEYNILLEKKKKLSEENEDVVNMMNEIESNKKEMFMKTYDAIREKFKKNFATLTKKGDADLELEDEETVFEGGVNIRVKLTGTKFLDIRSLSGGEKTLTALAFIFAIQEHDPASFYILDEVDAALDKHNSERLAELIEQYSKKAQYILISHNDSIISKASKLYGVSMTENNVSKIISLEI
ncbi:chromosome segregation protein SMC [Candidatus Woesearchaeota archaeon B3_Woes]|nr:MAG: chromosome segregation protein SMC [Candidatus Woesearchaeota archaeon B3_Woes]